MKVGTKSVLFGAHCFLIHPWFVAWAWWKLYGFPWDPRLWVAFFIHDLGYWGSPNMDGPEGERHPEWANAFMFRWFDRIGFTSTVCNMFFGDHGRDYWSDFVLYHSRFYAKKHGANPSRLCIADKLAICLTPAWLYLPMARASGEIHEYMADAHHEDGGRYADMGIELRAGQRKWYDSMRAYMRRWVEEHRDGREDTWTPDAREARDETGVWS